MRSTIILLALVVAIPFSSCKKENDDNNDGNTIPDLTFSFDVSGDITRSESFSSPENNNTQGGHDNGVICTHNSALNTFSISGQGSDYSFSISADMATVSAGNATVQHASFLDLSGTNTSYSVVESASLNLTSATLNYQAGVATFYNTAGSFNIMLSNAADSTQTVTFSGNFSGLHVTAS